MTGTTASVESVTDDVRVTLLAHRWQTAREVHERIGRWSHIEDAGEIETRLGGTLHRPVREYRAWK